MGYEKVVLVGWSGGGSLSLFYQAEAEQPSITQTPAGDEVDPVGTGLSPPAGIVFIAAHLSRAETLTEWIAPSVADELNPDGRTPDFDTHDSRFPHNPPFPPDSDQTFERNSDVSGTGEPVRVCLGGGCVFKK